MPTFKIAGRPVHIWIPVDRLLYMDSAAGGLTTVVRAALINEKGEAGVGTFEVEGRCEVLGAKVDAGEPTEVGQ